MSGAPMNCIEILMTFPTVWRARTALSLWRSAGIRQQATSSCHLYFKP